MFCDNLNQIGQVDFTLALGLHDNTQTDHNLLSVEKDLMIFNYYITSYDNNKAK